MPFMVNFSRFYDSMNNLGLSWKNSASFFLQAAIDAGLGSLDIAFEVPTPLGDYIDVALMGSSHNLDEQEFGRLLIVELKQWQSIYPYENENYVEISVGKNEKDIRRHPVSQIYEYKKHMENNHHGIYKNGRVKIDTLAYLHNFIDKESLLKGVYDVWDEFKEKVFVKNEEEKLVAYLRDSFSNANNSKLPEIIDDCGYIMGKVGFEGLLDALNGKENTTMVKDQMPVVDYVREHLMNQKKIPHKEIIVVSGGPGTGKTIVGMHFIYDYADIFQGKNNADGSVFCLPRSKTVKAIIDHECHSEIVPYLDNINRNQKVVVVDEAHRITGLKNTLDKVFNKGTNLLILLQDDHQRIRPGEDGILAGIENYANTNGIEFSILKLTIQKRCEALGKLLDGLDKMFYGENIFDGNSIVSVKVFDKLQTMDKWIENLATTSRSKLIGPYCWEWRGTKKDVSINDNGTVFEKSWNPGKPEEQVQWYLGLSRTDQVASIYTCQGLDFDNVAFIWWDDLVWDECNKKWKSNISKSRDKSFISGVKKAHLSQCDIDTLIINTYYVMLSRARNKLGIWFKDAATKKHVMEILGVEAFGGSAEDVNSSVDNNQGADQPRNVNNNASIIGNSFIRNYHKPNCQYAPRNPNKRVEFASVQVAKDAGYVPCRTCNPDME